MNEVLWDFKVNEEKLLQTFIGIDNAKVYSNENLTQ